MLTLLLSLSILSVCGAEEKGENSFEGQTLVIAAFEGGFGTVWHDLVTGFEEMYPGVTVELTTNPEIGEAIRPQMVAGEFPDIYYDANTHDMYVSLVNERAIECLNDVFDSPALGTDTPIKDLIVDGALDTDFARPYGDDIYCAPMDISVMGMFYNKALFENKGWEYPKTWDDFYALGDKAKEEGYALMTYQGIYPSYNEIILWPAIYSYAGEELVQDMAHLKEGAFSDPKAVEVFRQFARVGQEGYLLEGTTAMNHTQSQSEFMLDKALFIPNGNWMPEEMADAPTSEPYEWAMGPIFTMSETDTPAFNATFTGPVIPKGAKNKELAKEFLRYLYTEEAARIMAPYSEISTLKNVLDVTEDLLPPETAGLLSVMNSAEAMSFAFTSVEKSKIVVDDFVYQPISDVMNGTMSVDEWVETMEDMCRRIAAGE